MSEDLDTSPAVLLVGHLLTLNSDNALHRGSHLN